MYLLQNGKDYTFKDIQKANKQAGHFWFAKDAMKFFGTVLIDKPYTGENYWIFVSQEQPPYGPRIYNVRICYPNGHVYTVTKDIERLEDATDLAQWYAKDVENMSEDIHARLSLIEEENH